METFCASLSVCAGIHRSPVNSPHKGQWRGALMFSLICAWINGWVNNRESGDLSRHRAHYDVTVMDAYMRQWTSSALLQISACWLVEAKPFSKPMLVYCQLDPCEQISMTFKSKSREFIWIKLTTFPYPNQKHVHSRAKSYTLIVYMCLGHRSW